MQSKFRTMLQGLLIVGIFILSIIFSTPAHALRQVPSLPADITYIVSGNAGVNGATLSYDDGSPQTATADVNGDYAFTVPSGWSGTVTPSKTGYTFTPVSTDYTNVLSDQIAQNYTATAIIYTISGNAGVSGASLGYDDGGPQTAIADVNGDYSFTVSYNWAGTVTASKTGYSFSPASTDYTNVLSDQTGQNYTATAITYTIFGNAGVSGASLGYDDGGPQTATADGNGDYSFTVSYNWTGTVTPSKMGYNFTPASTDYSNVLSDQTSQNYTATAITYIISGNAGVSGATLSYNDGSPKTAIADNTGNYSFTISYNWTGMVTPSKPGYAFTPASKNYSNVLSGQTSQNYTSAIAKQVSAGSDHTCGIQPGGALHCWGSNDYHQTTPPSGTFTQISSGYRASCGLKTDGILICWGELGDPGIGLAPPGIFTQVSVGYAVACAKKVDNTLVCWGSDADGEVSGTPSGTFLQVSAGAFHACGLRMDGTLICWGWDGDGQVSNTPSGTYLQLSAGGDSACAMKADQTLICWGDDQYGELDAPPVPFKQFSVGGYGACGIKLDNTLACWGSDLYGEISSMPSGTFTQVEGGEFYVCGVRSNNRWVCWGRSDDGILSPYRISGNTGANYAVLHYTDNGPQTVSTVLDTFGGYTVGVSDGWSGTVTISCPNMTFSPASRTYNNVSADIMHNNYTPTVTLTSAGTQDGWVLESSKGSGLGGLFNTTSTSLLLGDNAANRQYRDILSFNIDSNLIIRNDVTIVSAFLELYRNGQAGRDPFSVLGKLLLDIRTGPFGNSALLNKNDFNAAASAYKVGGTFTRNGNWYLIPLTTAGRNRIITYNGPTQLRLYFSLPSNGNNAADLVTFTSGNGSAAFRPKLVITFLP